MWFRESDFSFRDVSSRNSIKLLRDQHHQTGDFKIVLFIGESKITLFDDEALRARDGMPLAIADVWQAIEKMLHDGLHLIEEGDKYVLSMALEFASVRVQLEEIDPDVMHPNTATLTVHDDDGAPVEHTFLADPLIDDI